MIITALTGGLGNQMFQYAAGLALAHRRRTVLKLDVSWYREHDIDERRYGLSCLNVTEQFATAAEVARGRGRNLTRTERWSAALARRLRLFRYADALEAPGSLHTQPRAGFDAAFAGLPDGTYLEGLWQSERYFAEIGPLLRRHFTFRYPPTPDVAELAARIASGPAVGVHVRRGDYVSHPEHRARNGALPREYYEEALGRLLPEAPGATVYVFSDEIEEAASWLRPSAPHVFVRLGPEAQDFDQLRLLSLCRHFVIANSTFSWWGAWLGAQPGKRVIGPRRWFADPSWDAADIMPPAWERL